jgi:lipopolysaccharide transport system ATP-binding protein
MKPAIRTEDLSKQYFLGPCQRGSYRTLRETLTEAGVALGRRLGSLRFAKRKRDSQDRKASAAGESLWALKDVSLEIQPGEVVGVIGRNGAGKSTLLKILTRITEPTAGRVVLRGRVGSLLEVGTGFHPELTGRENIYLNGAVLGMRRAEITRKFDDIVAFAEVEKFLDTPVKRYSSGMYVRLAFAVAAHLEPEILLVDEVLAVGDIAFQRKCLGKMGEVARTGRTILFVSHNMGAVLRLCNRCVWLSDGRVRSQGPAPEVVNAYVSCGSSQESERRWPIAEAPGDDALKVLSVRVCQPPGVANAAVDISKPFDIVIDTEVLRPLPEACVGIKVLSADGQVVLHTTNMMNPGAQLSAPGRWQVVCRLLAYTLNAGRYLLSLGADVPNQRVIFLEENVLSWTVEPLSSQMGRYDARAWGGVIGPGLANWSVGPADGRAGAPAAGLV